MTVALRPGTLEVVRSTPDVLRALLADLPDELLNTAGPEGWSPSDVVAHLVVAGRLGALDRASRALDEDSPSFAGYDEGGELDASGLRERRCGDLVTLLGEERSRSPVLTRRLSGNELTRTGVHAEVGAVSVAELLHQAAFHDSLHVSQIASLLSGAFVDGRGPLAAAQS